MPHNITSDISVPSSHSRSKACLSGICPDHLSEMSNLIKVIWYSSNNIEIWWIIV